MIKKEVLYRPMHSYLQRADIHYIDGRFLWFNGAIDGASILLWLCFEQIIKFLIVQKKFETFSGTSKEAHDFIDREFRKIDQKHKANKLISYLKEETGIDITKGNDFLLKINEFFNRRYYKEESTSIRLDLIFNLDNLYFFLRKNINEYIPSTILDDIILSISVEGFKPPLSYQAFILQDNNFIEPRKHPEYQLLLNYPEAGSSIKTNGIETWEA